MATNGTMVLSPQHKEQALRQLESLAERMYHSVDDQEREEARVALQMFNQSPSSIPQCQFLLEHSNLPAAIFLAASSLTKLLTVYWNQFEIQQTMDMRNYLLNYLAKSVQQTKSPPMYVLASVVRLICRVVKLGWSMDERHHDICQQVLKFLQSSHIPHQRIGLQILEELINEMISPIKTWSTSKQRKVLGSFRSSAILDAFKLSTLVIAQTAKSEPSSSNNELLEMGLRLAKRCLTSNFVGSQADEELEEYGSLMVPVTWKEIVHDPQLHEILFVCFQATECEQRFRAMELIGQLTRCRRSLFSSDQDRDAYLTRILEISIQTIANAKSLLTESESLRSFCRMHSNLKQSFQFSDFINLPNYELWLTSVARFTMDIMNQRDESWSDAPLHMLSMWCGIVKALRYTRKRIELPSNSPTSVTHSPSSATGTSLLSSSSIEISREDRFIALIAKHVVESQISILQQLPDYELEDVFGEQELDHALEYIPVLVRHVYEDTSQCIDRIVVTIANQYEQNLMQLSGKSSILNRLEIQLAYLIHVIASTISRRGALQVTRIATNTTDYYRIDAHLSVSVFRIVELTQRRRHLNGSHSVNPNKNIEIAILMFYEKLQTSYITSIDDFNAANGDSKKGGFIFALEFCSQLNLPTNPIVVLQLMVEHAIMNLSNWNDDEDVIELSIAFVNRIIELESFADALDLMS